MENRTLFSPKLVPLTLLQTFVQAIQVSVDPHQIGEVVSRVLSKALQSHLLSLYQADQTRQALRVLSRINTSSQGTSVSFTLQPQNISCPEGISEERGPLCIKDLRDPVQTELA